MSTAITRNFPLKAVGSSLHVNTIYNMCKLTLEFMGVRQVKVSDVIKKIVINMISIEKDI